VTRPQSPLGNTPDVDYDRSSDMVLQSLPICRSVFMRISAETRRYNEMRFLTVSLPRPRAGARLTLRVPGHLNLVKCHHFAIIDEEFIDQWDANAS